MDAPREHRQLVEKLRRCFDCGDATDSVPDHPERWYIYCPPCRARRRAQTDRE